MARILSRPSNTFNKEDRCQESVKSNANRVANALLQSHSNYIWTPKTCRGPSRNKNRRIPRGNPGHKAIDTTHEILPAPKCPAKRDLGPFQRMDILDIASPVLLVLI